MRERSKQPQSFDTILQKRVIQLSGGSDKPVSERFNREFLRSDEERFIADARDELRSPDLQPGLHVEIGHGGDPFWGFRGQRNFSATSQYLGIDGGTSEHSIGIGRGWLDYHYRENKFQRAHKRIAEEILTRPDKDYINFIAGDAKQMPLSDGAAREIYMKNVLLAPGVTIKDSMLMMKECYRVLEPGGLLIFRDDERSPRRVEGGVYAEATDSIGYMTLGIVLEQAGFDQIGLDEDMFAVYARKGVEDDQVPAGVEERVKRSLASRIFKR